MTPADLTKKVEEIYQSRLKDPNSLTSRDPLLFAEWNKYWLDCLSTHNEALYIDLLNRHNIPFVRKAMIMCDGTVLADGDYAAWYFTYPGLVKSTRKLIWDFGWQRMWQYNPDSHLLKEVWSEL